VDRKARVLIADDERDVKESLGAFLEWKGYEVLWAPTSDQAVSMAMEMDVDIVVLDVGMPSEDGCAVCRRLRAEEKTKSLPVLMLTCHGQVNERIEGFRAGADDYVVKPCENDELVERVEALLRRFPPRKRFYERIARARESIQAAEAFRRHIVVLNVDVEGSSKKPGSSLDEYNRMLRLREYRRAVSRAVTAFGGGEVAWSGDGGTAEFGSGPGAVSAAREILLACRKSTLSLRIGMAAGLELISPEEASGERTSQTHNRAGHFQKGARKNTMLIGKELLDVLEDAKGRRTPRRIDGETAFEVIVE